MNNRDKLNEIYKPLCEKANGILARLRELESTWGFYNNHSHKNEMGDYVADFYPIPVISVKGLCDIEIDFDAVSVTAKLAKEKALSIDYSDILGMSLEIYGVEDYLTDYYAEGGDIEAAKIRMSESTETEFFYTFSFSKSALSDDIVRFVKKLANGGFYY